MITNPEYLSKERLKNELKSHGIRYNSNENKQYYVKLYREHVMDSSGGTGMHGFSSDEEFSQRPGKSQRKQSPVKKKKTIKLDTYLSEVQGLIDEELKEELERFGTDCGPITDTTRALYQRMLAKLMSEHVSGKSAVTKASRRRESSEEEDEGLPTNESFVGEWSSEEDKDDENEEVQIVHSRRTYQAPPVAVSKRAGESSIREPPKRPSIRPIDDTPEPAKQRPKPRKPSKSSSAYYSFVVLLLMFVIAFFSYEHYTSSEEDPSLLTKGWKEIQCGWNWLKGYILKSRPAPTVPSGESTPTPTEAPPHPDSNKPTTSPSTDGNKDAPKSKAKSKPKKKNMKGTKV